MIGLYVQSAGARQVVETIQRAEAHGVPAVWLTMGGTREDATIVLGAAAALTERIKLGTSIFPMWGRHPIAFAQQCVAMAAIAPGRFRLGIGPSHQATSEALFGVPYKQPLGRLREQLAVLTSLIHTGTVDFEGKFFMTKAQMGAPIDVPVLASALRPASFRLCGELADGAISWVCPWDYLRDVALPEMRDAAASAGRPAPPLIAHVNVCLSDDRTAILAAAREQIGRYTRSPNYQAMFRLAGFADPDGDDFDHIVDTLVVSGQPAAIAARLGAILAEGAGEILVHPIVIGDDPTAYQDRVFDLVAQANRDLGTAPSS